MPARAYQTRPGRPAPVAEPAFAALDLGTNNCRLLVATPVAGGFRVIDSFSRIVRLGEGLHGSDLLMPEAMDRAVEALHACTGRLRRRPILRMRAVATQACRQASNGAAFLQRVRAETGLALQVIAPREEVELALESCRTLIEPAARRVLLFDIGGGSTEIAWVRVEAGRVQVTGFTSLPLGVVSLAGHHGPGAFEAIVADVTARLRAFERTHHIAKEVRQGGVQVVGTSGTVTTLAGIALGLRRYHRALVDGASLTRVSARAAIDDLRAASPEALHRHPCVGPERAAFTLPGCAVFQAILDLWSPDRVTVADRGLREGMLLRLMRQGAAERPPAGRRPVLHG